MSRTTPSKVSTSFMDVSSSQRGLLNSPRPGFPALVYRHRAGFGKSRRNPGSLRHFEFEWRCRDARICGHWRRSTRTRTTIFSCAFGGGALALSITGDREASMASLDHVIVLMLENNSFDRMLGALFPERLGGGGIKGSESKYWNVNPKTGQKIYLKPTKAQEVKIDPG